MKCSIRSKVKILGEKILKNRDYTKDFLVRMAHHSTAIEGNTLTLAETASILLHNYIPREMEEREYYEVKNYEKALEFMENNSNKMSLEKIKKYNEIFYGKFNR